MSRYYQMDVEITKCDLSRKEKIIEAANDEWDFEDWYADEYLGASGRSNLCGGESEEEFVVRLSRAVWKANGAYCPVRVTATYLEDLPTEQHLLKEDEYEQAKKAGLLESTVEDEN